MDVDHEQYLLGITNEQLYGRDINVSESLEANLSVDDAFEPFRSYFEPEEMRCLALIAHNHMRTLLLSDVPGRSWRRTIFHGPTRRSSSFKTLQTL